jgi:hypothetical protein
MGINLLYYTKSIIFLYCGGVLAKAIFSFDEVERIAFVYVQKFTEKFHRFLYLFIYGAKISPARAGIL